MAMEYGESIVMPYFYFLWQGEMDSRRQSVLYHNNHTHELKSPRARTSAHTIHVSYTFDVGPIEQFPP